MPDATSLAEQLAKQITASGPISVADYMRASNAEYYAKADPLGADGDFVTAPEISQIFGELVGLWFTDLWLRQGSPVNINYVELGPGRGTLASDTVRAMQKFGLDVNVHFVETSPALRAMQKSSFPDAIFHDDISMLPDDGPLFIVANEFFDALPVQQMLATANGWRERVVTRGQTSGFRAIPGSKNCDPLVPGDVRQAPEGSIYETSPDCSDMMYELAAQLDRQQGAMLIVDYGYAHPGFGSTLQAVRDHKHVDPFQSPGEIDLTAHVNFLEIANLARLRNLRVNGPVEQGSWLSALGVNQRAEMLAQKSPERAKEIMIARNRLANPDEMGSLFKVLAISAKSWPEPEGFERTII